MLDAMPVVNPLQVPKPAILAGGVAAMTGDYTWPVVLLVTTIVMLVLSARKGVRVFSFALTYTNQWFVFGKTGRVRVRVHSFTSATGSNCFTSGEFTAELVKDDEEDECEDSDRHSSSGGEKCPGAEQSACIVGTKMVFLYGSATSVFTAGSLSKTFRKGWLAERIEMNSSNLRATSSNSCQARLEGEFSGRGEEGEDLHISQRGVMVPEWAFSLLQPRQVVRVCTLPRNVLRGNAMAGAGNYPWDTNMKVRLEGHRSCHQIVPGEQNRPYDAAVVRGATHTATLRKNVVKIWENPSRRVVTALPIRKGDVISSMDVGWEKNAVLLGSSKGELCLWDLEKMVRVSSIGSHWSSVNALQSKGSVQLEYDSWMLSAGCNSVDKCRNRVCVWDSRVLTGAVGSTACSLNSSPVDDFKFAGLQLVVRDHSNRISVHDIRMLRSLPMIAIRADDTRISKGIQVATQLEEDQWWDVGAASPGHEEDDFWEDSWVRVEQEEKINTPSQRGVLSRCFSALSSALSR